jgi:hypothetical protein
MLYQKQVGLPELHLFKLCAKPSLFTLVYFNRSFDLGGAKKHGSNARVRGQFDRKKRGIYSAAFFFNKITSFGKSL